MGFSMKSVQSVAEFLNAKKWVVVDDALEQIVPLGPQWTNDNYVITVSELYGETRYFLRLGRETGLGLMARLAYEFTVLQAMSRSGMTPRPFYCDEIAKVDGETVGALLMEFLPGRSIDCASDWRLAAQTLARVHAQPVDSRLIVRKRPLVDMCDHCSELVSAIGRRGSGAAEEAGASLEALNVLADEARALLADDILVVTHGAVRASDFIVDEDGDKVWLIDWENGAVSSRYADIGLFMAQASGLCASGCFGSEKERSVFFEEYAVTAGLDIGLDRLAERVALFERAFVLRAAIEKLFARCSDEGGESE
jgi:aminoglycoside phosphotransferase (APT) family kinase protein